MPTNLIYAELPQETLHEEEALKTIEDLVNNNFGDPE
jgi:hypothetical protein